MSKAILVIDKPNNCSECRIVHPDLGGYYCPFEPIHIPNKIAMAERMGWCPLKPMPEKISKENSYVSDIERDTWNSCIDEMLGGYITQEEADCCGVQFWHDD